VPTDFFVTVFLEVAREVEAFLAGDFLAAVFAAFLVLLA
jgi:hypothetical protein